MRAFIEKELHEHEESVAATASIPYHCVEKDVKRCVETVFCKEEPRKRKRR